MVPTRRFAGHWGVYAALGVALGLILGHAEHNKASAAPTQSPTQQAPAKTLQPSDAAVIHGDTQRIATALEARNRYDESSKGQEDAHDAAKAAWDAAKWAQCLFWAGVAETLVTAAGVLLVYFTLKEARRSANEANRGANEMKRSADAAVESNRAWLKIVVEPSGPFVYGTSGIWLDSKATIENVGRSPATRVRASTGLGVEAKARRKESSLPDGVQWAVNKSRITRSERVVYDIPRTREELSRLQTIGDALFPGEERSIATADWKISNDELRAFLTEDEGSGVVAIFFAVTVEYKTGGRWGTTTAVYAVERAESIHPEAKAKVGDAFRFWDCKRGGRAEEIVLRKLQIHSTAE